MVTISIKRWYVVVAALALIAVLLSGCVGSSGVQTELNQQNAGVKAIIQNQPVPDLGGYSFPRQVVIETYVALNKPTSTWSYILTYSGQLWELCPSYGYPIPGGTELTNPTKIAAEIPEGLSSYETGVVGNPEPNGLYPPPTSAGTLVNCVNSDGTTSPAYVEADVVAFPYRMQADRILQRTDNSTPSIVVNPNAPKALPPPSVPPTTP